VLRPWRIAVSRLHIHHRIISFPSNPAVCDPVMGDNGKLFLPAELVPIYQNIIVPLAATLTPNAFEAEQLTGLKIENENDALAACRALHERGPTTVVSALCTPCLLWLPPAWHSFLAEINGCAGGVPGAARAGAFDCGECHMHTSYLDVPPRATTDFEEAENEGGALAACLALHERGPSTVVSQLRTPSAWAALHVAKTKRGRCADGVLRAARARAGHHGEFRSAHPLSDGCCLGSSYVWQTKDEAVALAACRALHERAPTTMVRLCTQSPCNMFGLRKGVLQCGAMAE